MYVLHENFRPNKKKNFREKNLSGTKFDMLEATFSNVDYVST